MSDKITKKIRIDLGGVPQDKVKDALSDVGELVMDNILRKVSTGQSPVNGYGPFPRLNPEYAKTQKGGNRTANLDLTGSMLNSLDFKIIEDGIEIGIFKSSELGKADGHNNFSGGSPLPLRRFIPADDESFTEDIEASIRSAVEAFKEEPQERQLIPTQVNQALTDGAIGITVDDILGREAFDRLFGDGES